MARECDFCGQWCYCDMDDIGGLPQPDDCPHLNGHCDSAEDDDELDELEESEE